MYCEWDGWSYRDSECPISLECFHGDGKPLTWKSSVSGQCINGPYCYALATPWSLPYRFDFPFFRGYLYVDCQALENLIGSNQPLEHSKCVAYSEGGWGNPVRLPYVYISDLKMLIVLVDDEEHGFYCALGLSDEDMAWVKTYRLFAWEYGDVEYLDGWTIFPYSSYCNLPSAALLVDYDQQQYFFEFLEFEPNLPRWEIVGRAEEAIEAKSQPQVKQQLVDEAAVDDVNDDIPF